MLKLVVFSQHKVELTMLVDEFHRLVLASLCPQLSLHATL